MIRSRRLGDACFQALVAISQAFISVVAGLAVAFAFWSCPSCEDRRRNHMPKDEMQSTNQHSGGQALSSHARGRYRRARRTLFG